MSKNGPGITPDPVEILVTTRRYRSNLTSVKVRLDGLPVAQKAWLYNSDAMLSYDFALRFWADYFPRWKPSTRKSNRARVIKGQTDIFDHLRVDVIRKTDVLR